MNEREQFLQAFQSRLTTYVHRIQTMNETEVLNGLRTMQAARNSLRDELGFLNSVSLAPTEDPDDEINKLRRQLSSTERAGLNPLFWLDHTWLDHIWSDHLEDALKERLEVLRRKPRSNS